MNLYKITAKWADADGVENHDLWVRAESAKDAFDLWASYYQRHEDNEDGSPYRRSQAEDSYDCGFGIEKKKRYPFDIPAGVVSWDEFESRLVGAL